MQKHRGNSMFFNFKKFLISYKNLINNLLLY